MSFNLKSLGIILLVVLISADFFVWYEVFFNAPVNYSRVYFLNVSQGDSELIVFENNVKVLVDAGPDNRALKDLSQILSPLDHYVDLAIITHPQLDHYNGFNEILKYYKVGAVIYDGRESDLESWKNLVNLIKNQNIPLVALLSGDKINYRDNEIKILSPSIEFLGSAELNDVAIVSKVKTPSFSLLLTSDIGKNIEDFMVNNHLDLKSDILKIAHHGSKYSSGIEFLKSVNPKVAVIEVGTNNYGHPAPEVIQRLKDLNIKFFQTLTDGTIEIYNKNGLFRAKFIK